MTRPLRSLIALAMVAVIAAGCGNAPGDSGRGGSVGTDTSSDHDQAVRFAECMRTNGVTAFPDPDGSGQLTIDAIANGSGVDPNTAAFEQALRACQNLRPPGFTGHKRNDQQQERALEFAKCIRDNGVKDFPDPDPDGPLVDTNRIPSSDGKGGMSALNAAMQACRDVGAAAGASGPR